jgi:thiol-disulfide isomerase/thioredoxin
MAVAIVIVAAVMLTARGGSSSKSLSLFDNVPVPQSLLGLLAVPSNLSNAIGAGAAQVGTITNVSGAAMRINGKPAVLYVGADYCPYCAVTRWALVVALLRFGNFTGLRYMTSSPSDLAPSSPTFTFYNSTYSSSYIDFVAVELAGNKPVNGTYPTLQALNSTETAIMAKYDQGGGIPFTDFANESVQRGSAYTDPTILDLGNWTAIAGGLHNSSSIYSIAIVGAADIYTAEICRIDGNQPAGVCGQAYVQAIQKQLK